MTCMKVHLLKISNENRIKLSYHIARIKSFWLNSTENQEISIWERKEIRTFHVMANPKFLKTKLKFELNFINIITQLSSVSVISYSKLKTKCEYFSLSLTDKI